MESPQISTSPTSARTILGPSATLPSTKSNLSHHKDPRQGFGWFFFFLISSQFMLIIYLTQAWKGTWTTGNYKIQLLESLLSTQRKQRHDTPPLQTSKVDDHMACSSWNTHDLGSQAADHTAVSETRSWTITDVLAAILTIQLQQSCLQPQRGGHGFSQHTQLSSSHWRTV